MHHDATPLVLDLFLLPPFLPTNPAETVVAG